MTASRNTRQQSIVRPAPSTWQLLPSLERLCLCTDADIDTASYRELLAHDNTDLKAFTHELILSFQPECSLLMLCRLVGP